VTLGAIAFEGESPKGVYRGVGKRDNADMSNEKDRKRSGQEPKV